MVAQTTTLPNIRKIFIPDVGYTLIEADKQRADAQVVAWEADDDELKSIFRSGKDIHTENALAIYGGPVIDKSEPGYHIWYEKRHRAKQGVHAVNYGCKAKTLAETLKCSVATAQDFITGWFSAHPKIRTWHNRTEMDLMTRGCVENKFGYKRHYFGRTEDLLGEALGWIAQSTVAIAINHALLNIEHNVPECELLLQVHDSILFQIPTQFLPQLLPKIRSQLIIPIPYPDPLIIPITLKSSTLSWGDMEELPL